MRQVGPQLPEAEPDVRSLALGRCEHLRQIGTVSVLFRFSGTVVGRYRVPRCLNSPGPGRASNQIIGESSRAKRAHCCAAGGIDRRTWRRVAPEAAQTQERRAKTHA